MTLDPANPPAGPEPTAERCCALDADADAQCEARAEWWVHKATEARAHEVPLCPRHLADTFHLAAYRRPDLVELRAFRIPATLPREATTLHGAGR